MGWLSKMGYLKAFLKWNVWKFYDCTALRTWLIRNALLLKWNGNVLMWLMINSCWKKTHMYYFQIQLELLITEAKYCEFVLYSNKGPISVERINPDFNLQSRIVESTRLFWEKVYLPEYFLMRVPRGLMPLVM